MEREQIIKALECCKSPKLTKCYGCPRDKEDGHCMYRLSEDALELITSQEQKIFELENRLKECENGYEGTLFLDRCKLHDAEEYVKELIEENERLRARYTIDERYKFCNLIGDTLVYNKTLEDYNKFRANWRADTVRKMQERITVHATNGYPRKVRLDVIDQISKEMVEGAI